MEYIEVHRIKIKSGELITTDKTKPGLNVVNDGKNIHYVLNDADVVWFVSKSINAHIKTIDESQKEEGIWVEPTKEETKILETKVIEKNTGVSEQLFLKSIAIVSGQKLSDL